MRMFANSVVSVSSVSPASRRLPEPSEPPRLAVVAALPTPERLAAPLPPPVAPPSPFQRALAWRPRTGDLRAGWVSAIVMLPQAVAFAVIAGLPPEMGIYASVIPVIVAAVLGAAPRLLSGPNTAVSVMIGAALLPLAAPGSADYLALAAALSAMVGLVQIVAALGGVGKLLALLPPFVSNGLTAGIGVVMIASQLAPASGLMSVPEAAPWLSAWYAALGTASMNPYAVLVALSAIVAGQAATRFRLPGVPSLVAAMIAGTVVAWAIDECVGSATAGIDRVGQLQVLLLPWSVPRFDWDEWYVLKQLAHSAIAISIVGGLQTVVISRAISAGRPVSARRELVAQGAANIAASLTGGFAGSGSFNRTAAHVKAGAETPVAAILSSVLLLLLAWTAGPLFAYIAAPAVAGTIALIGWGMLRSGCAAIRRDSGFSRAAALVSMASALAVGVESALTLVAMLGFASLVIARGSNAGESPR